jgi:diaminohydroxyphosphoribosylaminopyrimidine deaminase/5-amino-6-(5-phosphoribosylamino)uracil reductase
MTKACELALKGKGFTAPNPLVGAIVLDKAGNIVGQGFHPRAGEPHAEVFAITEALKTQPEKSLEDCQLYVTLEPCHHFGRTPPCTDLILKAGIKTVFVGAKDPNPLMQGESLKMLRSAGVNVHIVAADDPNYGFCLELIRGFESVLSKGRPYVTLKAGASIDGKMATGSGESQWITNDKSRAMAHFLRSRHDAIAIGVGTVIKDNPRLNPRLPDQEYLRKKIIFDTKLRSPAEANVFSSPGDSIVFCGPERNSNKKVQLESLACQCIG